MRAGRGGVGAAMATACLSALLVLAPLARASDDPVGDGTTRLVLDKAFRAFLKRNGIDLSTTGSARLKAGAVVLSASGGTIDPVAGKGSIEQAGALIFRGHKRLPLRSMVVNTAHTPLVAKVGGSQLKVATSTKIASEREGFGMRFSARKLKLTAKVATRLNKKLRPSTPFEAGQPLGSLVSKTQPLTATILAENRAMLALDPGLVSTLASLHVSLNPISPAELMPGPLFTLPMIVGGAISANAQIGTLRTGGSIELLQLHAGQIFWHELWFDLSARTVLAEVDVEPSPPYPGKLSQLAVLDLDLGPASISSDPTARTIAVSGARLSLQAATATAFNQAFAEGKEAFKAGDAVGTISFIAQAQ